jgi:N-acetylglutamate synthase/N-acetylornithine aminotransferase
MVFNATFSFSNISVVLWQSVLLVEETGENETVDPSTSTSNDSVCIFLNLQQEKKIENKHNRQEELIEKVQLYQDKCFCTKCGYKIITNHRYLM